MCLAIFEYLAIFKYVLISEQQFKNILKTFSNLFFAIQTIAKIVEFLLDNIILLNKQLQQQITNKLKELRYVKLDLQNTYLQIGYIISLAYTNNKANIYWLSILEYKQTIYNILVAKLYIIVHRFIIEKRYW